MADPFAPAAVALRARFGDALLVGEPLARHTTFRIGGPAALYLPLETVSEIVEAVGIARAYNVPHFLLGGGSNVLVADAGVDGLVLGVRARRVTIKADGMLLAEAGASLAGVARRAIRSGLAGLEWAVSVPGSIGGAVAGNAGAHDGCIADHLTRATLLTPEGRVDTFPVDWFLYGYRQSRIKGGVASPAYVILSAEFHLEPGDPTALAARAERFLTERRASQPTEASVGSIFRNPAGDYAGRLLEEAGLKGERVGQAQISPVHANFIVNLGGASAADVYCLIRLARDAVEARFQVRLVPEILFLGLIGPDVADGVSLTNMTKTI